MSNLGIHAAMGETVRTVGPISFVKMQGADPTYDIVHEDHDYDPCGSVERDTVDTSGSFKAVLYEDLYAGPDLIAIGQFVNELNEYYADDGNRDAKDLDPEG